MTQTPLRRVLLALAPVVLLTACGSTGNVSWSKPETLFGLLQPNRVDVVQGNVVTQEVMALIQPGLGRAQVREILGTPLVTSLFYADRWEYVFTLKRPGVEAQTRKLTVFFKGDALERYEGDEMPTESDFVAGLDTRKGKHSIPSLEATEAQLAKYPAPAADKAEPVPAEPARRYPPLESPAR